jgi:hypothetical protein
MFNATYATRGHRRKGRVATKAGSQSCYWNKEFELIY